MKKTWLYFLLCIFLLSFIVVPPLYWRDTFSSAGLPSWLYDRRDDLQSLSIQGNFLSVGLLEGMQSLRSLEITDSQVKRLKGLPPTLEALVLSNTGIVSMEDVRLPKLKDLVLRHNSKLTDFAFLENFPELEKLVIANHDNATSLATVPWSHLTSLKELSLDNVHFGNASVGLPASLRVLHMRRVDSPMVDLASLALSELVLKEADLEALPKLPASLVKITLSDLYRVAEVDLLPQSRLAESHILNLPRLKMSMLKLPKSLHALSLHRLEPIASFKRLAAMAPDIEDLRLNDLSIEHSALSELNDWPLRQLSLARLDIHSFEFLNLPTLQRLEITSCLRLSGDVFASATAIDQLTSLSLALTSVKVLDLAQFPQLEVLDLRQNHRLAFLNGLTNHQRLRDITFWGFQNSEGIPLFLNEFGALKRLSWMGKRDLGLGLDNDTTIGIVFSSDSRTRLSFENITELTLQGAALPSLRPLEKLTGLTSLDIENVKLAADSALPVNVTTLILGNSEIRAKHLPKNLRHLGIAVK